MKLNKKGFQFIYLEDFSVNYLLCNKTDCLIIFQHIWWISLVQISFYTISVKSMENSALITWNCWSKSRIFLLLFKGFKFIVSSKNSFQSFMWKVYDRKHIQCIRKIESINHCSDEIWWHSSYAKGIVLCTRQSHCETLHME